MEDASLLPSQRGSHVGDDAAARQRVKPGAIGRVKYLRGEEDLRHTYGCRIFGRNDTMSGNADDPPAERRSHHRMPVLTDGPSSPRCAHRLLRQKPSLGDLCEARALGGPALTGWGR